MDSYFPVFSSVKKELIHGKANIAIQQNQAIKVIKTDFNMVKMERD
jgi:hypothetical protein